MPFTQEELPPIFQHIIDELKNIEDEGTPITIEDFKNILYSLRITEKDTQEIRNWMKQKGYINIQHNKIHLNIF
jgi:hypothetical protein